MQVLCIKGEAGILVEGDIYTVVEVTKKGNYLLAEVDVPKPYTSFDASRFMPLQDDPIEEEYSDFINEGGENWPPDHII